MGTPRPLPDRGAVMTCARWWKFVLLVRKKNHRYPLWTLPGGSLEPEDVDVIAAAIRELKEETTDPRRPGGGIVVSRRQIELLSVQRGTGRDYWPNLCFASLTKEQYEHCGEVGDEDGEELEVRFFKVNKVLGMEGVHARHRMMLRQALSKQRVV